MPARPHAKRFPESRDERTARVCYGAGEVDIHVVISLVGILSGLVVMFGLIAGKQLNGWTAIFLATTVATSVTGFGFPFHKLEPPHIVGLISLVVLAIAIVARTRFISLADGVRLTW